MACAGDELFNPLTGERILFRATAIETGGELLEMDDYWTRPGHRALEHVHPGLEERWQVIAGVACFRIDGVETTAAQGEVVIAPPGALHLAWNSTGQPVHLRIQMQPALEWERFVERLFRLATDAHNRRQETPDPSLRAGLLREFPREIALPQPGSGS
ncbi:MAG: cupin domain-containing protein [Solirubrobacteraceae bacterium]